MLEYFFNESVSGYHVEGLTKVYCSISVLKADFAAIRSRRIVCVMCFRRVFVHCLGSETVESGICGFIYCITTLIF